MARIRGAKEHAARLRRLVGPEAQRRIGEALFVAGQNIQVEAQISITRGSISGKNHVPSLPGQPPNNDTAVLANNIETVQTGPLRVQVSSNAPYAAALEYGTSKMAARPYMAPAVAIVKGDLAGDIAVAINRLSGGARSSSAAKATSRSEQAYFGGAQGGDE